MSTYYESCCDRLPGDCICGEEPAPHCRDCGEALPPGEEVTRDGWGYCRACNADAVEATREEETRC